jgi:hypothetical protein
LKYTDPTGHDVEHMIGGAFMMGGGFIAAAAAVSAGPVGAVVYGLLAVGGVAGGKGLLLFGTFDTLANDEISQQLQDAADTAATVSQPATASTAAVDASIGEDNPFDMAETVGNTMGAAAGVNSLLSSGGHVEKFMALGQIGVSIYEEGQKLVDSTQNYVAQDESHVQQTSTSCHGSSINNKPENSKKDENS